MPHAVICHSCQSWGLSNLIYIRPKNTATLLSCIPNLQYTYHTYLVQIIEKALMDKLIVAVGALSSLISATPMVMTKSRTSYTSIALGQIRSYHGDLLVAYDPTRITPEEPCPPTFAIKADTFSSPAQCPLDSSFAVGSNKKVKLECDSINPDVPKYVLDSSGTRAWTCVASRTSPATCADGGSFLHQTYLCTPNNGVSRLGFQQVNRLRDSVLHWLSESWYDNVAEGIPDAQIDIY